MRKATAVVLVLFVMLGGLAVVSSAPLPVLDSFKDFLVGKWIVERSVHIGSRAGEAPITEYLTLNTTSDPLVLQGPFKDENGAVLRTWRFVFDEASPPSYFTGALYEGPPGTEEEDDRSQRPLVKVLDFDLSSRQNNHVISGGGYGGPAADSLYSFAVTNSYAFVMTVVSSQQVEVLAGQRILKPYEAATFYEKYAPMILLGAVFIAGRVLSALVAPSATSHRRQLLAEQRHRSQHQE